MSKYLPATFFQLWLVPLIGAVLVTWVSYAMHNSFLRRGLSREGYLHCGQCGYIVNGLSTWCCPECGSHLTAAGIRTVTDFVPFPTAYRLLIWLLLAVGPAYIGTIVTLYLIPQGHSSSTQLWVGTNGLPIQITIDATGYGRASSPRFTDVRLSIEAPTANGTLVEIAQRNIVVRGWNRTELNAESIHDAIWRPLAGEGIDLATSTLAAAELKIVIEAMATNEKPQLTRLNVPSWGQGVMSRFDSQPWWPVVILLVWVLIVLAGWPAIDRASQQSKLARDKHRVAVIERFKAEMAPKPSKS